MTKETLADTAAALGVEMTPAEKIADCMARLDLTIDAVFVPFSQSRKKDEKSPSLNWTVTVKRNGRPVLITDYTAGIGHAPSHKVAKVPAGYPGNLSRWKAEAGRLEAEGGLTVKEWRFSADGMRQDHGKPIMPDPVNVIWSLTRDADVLDAGGFENWAADYGYDTDSRKAESIYRACLETALKLRAAIGDDGLSQLRDAGQDY